MKIFSYGSLLCEDSFRKTVKKFEVIGPATLEGYKRVFSIESPYRKNRDTGIYSSVLNLELDSNIEIFGIVYEISSEDLEVLHQREAGYALKKIRLKDGTLAYTYIADVDTPYSYVDNDSTQREYLNICLKASKKRGDAFYNNFIDSTFIGNASIREML